MIIDRRALVLTAAAAAAASPASAQAVPPGAPGDPRPRAYKLLGQPAPDFTFPKLGGGDARLGDYRGKTLILYWWGLWCPDCVLDGANVAALANDVAKDSRLAFLAIHTRGRFGKWGSVPAYFEERGYSYPVALDGGREFARDVYRIEWYPSFLAIDRKGIIRAWRTDLGAKGGAAFLAEARALASA
jgi:thiol-disulfide isomerase/thioredoxin